MTPAWPSRPPSATIARELRKYNVTLMVIDQRPGGIDSEVMSQLGTRLTCLLDNERDIDAVLAGTAGSRQLRGVLARLEARQQALIFGHAVPMPVVVQTRDYGTAESYAQLTTGSKAGGGGSAAWGDAGGAVATGDWGAVWVKRNRHSGVGRNPDVYPRMVHEWVRKREHFMQNRYVGDVGDFGKFGLLRWLTGMTGPEPQHELRLGVFWYLHHDVLEGGNLRNYGQIRECDRWLYFSLNLARLHPNPSVQLVPRDQLLPIDTKYFRNCRCEYASRDDWLKDSRSATVNVELVFLDPDNGILLADAPPSNDSPKHAYLSDLDIFGERRQSVVMYHHLSRNDKYPEQFRRVGRKLRERLPQHEIRALRFGGTPPNWHYRIPGRSFFIAEHRQHNPRLTSRLDSFVNKSPFHHDTHRFCFQEVPIA